MPLTENNGDYRSTERTRSQTPSGDFPCCLLFPRTRVYAHHQIDDIEGSGDVEELEEEVPPVVIWSYPEQIQIPRAKHKSVEDLGQERNTFCGAIAMNRDQKGDLGRGMRGVGQDAEDVHGGALGAGPR